MTNLDAPPTTELTFSTRFEQSRGVAALLAELSERSEPDGDVALVTRDIDRIEESLTRDARRYGIELSAWTQLNLKRTLPYRLAVDLCEILSAETVSLGELMSPIELGWTPAEGAETAPATWSDVSDIRTSLGDLQDDRSVTEWRQLADARNVPRIERFCDWLQDRTSAPDPQSARETLATVVETFREQALPVIEARDSLARTETETDARAVVRLTGEAGGDEGLLGEMAESYRDRLDRGAVDRTWETVAALCDQIATQAPGRREHSNAAVVDLLEANDVWTRSFPYVIALDLVDGEWPQRPMGSLPGPVRARIHQGGREGGTDSDARSLAVRASWTEELDRDHFVDMVDAAERHLFVCRFTQDVDGVSRQRSPLLAELDTVELSDEDQRQVVDPEGGLPERVLRRLPETCSEVDR